MKLSKVSQLVLVSAIGLLVAISLSGCLIVTIDYLYVADSSGSGVSSPGQIQVYAVDSESGALRPGAPPYPPADQSLSPWPPLPTMPTSTSPTKATTRWFTLRSPAMAL